MVKKKVVAITKQLCQNALCIIDRGLSEGLTEAGKVCIEYAVAIASGQPDDRDGPKCVHPKLRDFKIRLNDELPFNNDLHRARALRRIGIAQLGTNKGFSWKNFVSALRDYNERFLTDYLATLQLTLKPVSKADQATVLKALKTQDLDDLESARDVINELYSEAEDRPNTTVLRDCVNNDSTSFIVDLIYNNDDMRLDQPDFEAYVEGVVQILKKMKTPGSKFLYLTEGKKKFKLDAAIAASLKQITR